ncbi:chaperonin 10-like protein [Podospora australis]|uniref:Chaperonin 10-like protein n=1 Tax=Podospora australis TaxID=1536484 RepID=A0AAN6WUA5_9PEZI|nr:chaperonin 10-like protein [Podospora australis]
MPPKTPAKPTGTGSTATTTGASNRVGKPKPKSAAPKLTRPKPGQLPKHYRRAVFKEKGGDLSLEMVELKPPGANEILVKVEACGVCFSDTYSQYNAHNVEFPLCPGHEIIGRVASIGSNVVSWKVGQRIGSGWYGGSDGTCFNCHNGYFQMCENGVVNGVGKNGGYAEYCLINQEAGVVVPNNIKAEIAAPLLCAGVTVYNTLKRANLNPGSNIVVQGMGGLGHLAIAYGRAMGHRIIVVSRGKTKEQDAYRLGASVYIDSAKLTPETLPEAIKKTGLISLAITTAPKGEVISPLVTALGPEGKLMVLSVPEGGEQPLPVSVYHMLIRGLTVGSWPSGHSRDSEEAVSFAVLNGIETWTDAYPLEKANEAFKHMLSGGSKYRTVITMPK